MARHIISIAFYCLALLTGVLSADASSFLGRTTAPTLDRQFLTPKQAFNFTATQLNNTVELTWRIAPGYYLYKPQIKLIPLQLTLGEYTLPTGQPYYDEAYGNVEVYQQKLILLIPLQTIQDNSELKVSYQGCAISGFCYPPETEMIKINPLMQSAESAVTTSADRPAIMTSSNSQNNPTPSIPYSPLWALLIGLGIAFTPCVLPMYPLISGIILGPQRLNTKRIFVLAITYVQGMAITYTLLGLIVSAAGLQFQAAFQHPYLLIALSAVFILLALSMFGVYELQLPSSIQTKLTHWSNTQRGGSLFGVLIMGAIAGLICSPCTTAPLSAILLYIAQSGNLWLGGVTLYLYALGMGIPLIAFALFGHRLLPKSGPWMQDIKEIFGFIILALPLFLLERLLTPEWGERLWSLWTATLFSWVFITSLHVKKLWIKPLQVLLLLAALISTKPLQEMIWPSSEYVKPALRFQPINSVNDLEQALQHVSKHYVMVDLYADWCSTCKQFDNETFSHPNVQAALSAALLLRADVTDNTSQHAQLLQHLNVLGLPTILFFDQQGSELSNSRVTGFMNAQDFYHHLTQLPTGTAAQ